MQQKGPFVLILLMTCNVLVYCLPQDGKGIASNETCSLPPDYGPCDQYLERWFYNHTAQACQMFIYGGCEGNENNFLSERECMSFCKPQYACSLPEDTGSCDKAIERWFFNQTSRRCETFVYGGCEGNENSFASLRDCAMLCICSLPREPGRCKAIVSRWFFNPNTQCCEEFTFGGCGGNANNFFTDTDCKTYCSSNRRQRSCV